MFIITWFGLACMGIASAQEAPTHTVQPGDTLYGIAASNGMSVAELKRLNGLSGDIIHAGQVLRLAAQPGPPHDDGGVAEPIDRNDEYVESAPPGGAPVDTAALSPRGVTTHTARQGETLYSIAADYGTKAYILFALNDGIRAPLEPGIPVVVPASTRAATYEVRRGDTLSEIAGAQSTTVAELRRANSLTSDLITVGQVLTISGAAAGANPVQDGMKTYALGNVTVFSDSYAGSVMAGGVAYDPDAFVVAHRDLPFETVLIVENAETGRASFATVADRSPAGERYLMAISGALASEIGIVEGGLVRVRLVE